MPTHKGAGFQLPHRGLVSNSDRAMQPRHDVPRSRFAGSWTRKTTFDAGKLIPILVDEVLPGDHLSYDITAYVRMATPLFPIFDNMRIDTHFFFVPNRLLWDNWQRFMGEQLTPGDTFSNTAPVMADTDGIERYSVGDHFGLPVSFEMSEDENTTVSALPFRAYRLIYYEWFRDQNNAPSTTPYLLPPTGNGPDAWNNYVIYNRAKTADYFTTALPFPTKVPLPVVPVQGFAPLEGFGWSSGQTQVNTGDIYQTSGVLVNVPYMDSYAPSSGIKFRVHSTVGANAIPNGVGVSGVTPGGITQLSLSVPDMRMALQMQQLLETDMRGGTRYIEMLKAHFGVTSSDARLQRPEYIGGGSTPLNVTPVAQTAPGDDLTVGSLGAAATGSGSHRASFASTEHGLIIGLISVKSELSYQQGLPRMFSRRTRYDYYFPALAHLTEQTVLTKELVWNGVGDANLVFGYQERWQEYRVRQSDVVAAFRSGFAFTLDRWHLAQYFIDAPVLDQSFIEDRPPMDRILAAGEEAENQQFFADILYRRVAVRPLPTFGVPASLGRF